MPDRDMEAAEYWSEERPPGQWGQSHRPSVGTEGGGSESAGR